MDKPVAVILSGCGYLDGAEITESVSAMIALGQQGLQMECFAPSKNFKPVPHMEAEQPAHTPQERNTLHESARIARGQVKPLAALDASKFSGLVFPGGYGAALHLSDWAEKGASCDIMPEVRKAIEFMHQNERPILAICVAPVLLGRVLGRHAPTLSVGAEGELSQELEKTGATHSPCGVKDFLTDRERRLVCTPAYLYGEASAFEVFSGISAATKEFAGLV